jgi:hypothetical protein
MAPAMALTVAAIKNSPVTASADLLLCIVVCITVLL